MTTSEKEAWEKIRARLYAQQTAEQRVREDAHLAQRMNKPATCVTYCEYCDKFVADFYSFPETKPEDLLASGAVPVCNIWFCSHTCADAYERDFGIRFQRDSSGKVSHNQSGSEPGTSPNG